MLWGCAWQMKTEALRLVLGAVLELCGDLAKETIPSVSFFFSQWLNIVKETNFINIIFVLHGNKGQNPQ